MKETIDTLMAIAGTLEAVAGDDYELNQFNYEISEAWDKLTEGNTALIEYLENEYHQGHYKGPLIKRLEVALMEAEDVINAAFKDAEGDVYHDWKAVAALCKEWISAINDYYCYNPEPGTIAHAMLQRLNERPVIQVQAKPQAREKNGNETPAAKKLASPELQAVRQKLVDAGFIKDGNWMLSPVHFKELVFELRAQWDVENRGGYAWTDCARWAGYTTDKNAIKTAQNAGKVNPGKAMGDVAGIIRDLCLKHTK